MVSYCGKSSENIHHFRCITSDITANKHLPDSFGRLCGVRLENGDEIYDMKAHKAYCWDRENTVWLP